MRFSTNLFRAKAQQRTIAKRLLMYQYQKLTPKQKAELRQQRLQHGYPLHSPPHPVLNQPFYLITAACYQHKPRLDSPQRRQELLN